MTFPSWNTTINLVFSRLCLCKSCYTITIKLYVQLIHRLLVSIFFFQLRKYHLFSSLLPIFQLFIQLCYFFSYNVPFLLTLICTSKSSIVIPSIPFSFFRESFTSTPDCTVYTAWSNSQFVALISKSLLAVAFSEEPLSSVCSAELSTSSFVLLSLLLPPQAASTRIKPNSIVANILFLKVNSLLSYIEIPKLICEFLTKSIVLTNYQ